jgi:RimJ/RimL family protein N-acetyltransferase
MPAFPGSPTLRHGDLVLREWSEEDAPVLRGICGDPDVCRFTSVPWTYSRESLSLSRIELAILPENRASRRVAERLGARSEGLRRESHEAEGRRWDMETYSLTPPPRGRAD